MDAYLLDISGEEFNIALKEAVILSMNEEQLRTLYKKWYGKRPTRKVEYIRELILEDIVKIDTYSVPFYFRIRGV
jgi:hypothetical protein